MPLTLKIMDQQQEQVNEPVRSVSIPGYEGDIGILPKRQQVLARLKKGNIRYATENGEEKSFAIKGGIAYNDGESVTVLLS